MRTVLISLFLLVLTGCGDETLRLRKSSSSNSNALTNSTPCPALYSPVCGQPPMPTCPEGMSCAQVMPQPVTYDNECQMNKAGATMLNYGTCP